MATRSTRSLYRVEGTRSVALKGGSHLVGNVVDERIGLVAVLLHVGNRNVGKWRHLFGSSCDPNLRSDEVDAERAPFSRADEHRHRQSERSTTGGYGTAGTDLESKPISNVPVCGRSQVGLCLLERRSSIYVDIDRLAYREITC